MEILTISDLGLKIKGKKAAIVIDPDASMKGKVEADAIVSTKGDFNATKVEGYRVILQGVGEYEISGIKISGVKTGKQIIYEFNVDGINIGLTNTSAIEVAKDTLTDNNILILHADSVVDFSLVAALEPSVAMFYGEHAKEVAKDNVTTTSKFSVTKDKLPDQMQTIILRV